MTDRRAPDGDYQVGHGRPPKATRWQKGQSGNPKGRPKTRKAGAVDISNFLNEPIEARIHGKTRKMHPFEGMVWQMAQKALQGNLTNIISFIELCDDYGLILTPPPENGGGVIFAPKGMTPAEYVKQFADPVDDE